MLDSRQRALWERLESFDIGTGDEPVSFARRLARENAWSTGHAERVVREYLRFVFLCAESGHPCTPSDAVDQAWHLHLVYTWSYWNELCPLLPHPLHHGPTKGGATEDAKHRDWYARTLDRYRRLYGEEPPVDVWPATFEPEEETVRVSRRRFWLVPRRWAMMAALGTLPLAVGGCGLDSNAVGPLFLVLFVVVLVAVASASASDSRRPRRRGSGDGGDFSSDGGSFGDSGSHAGGGHHGSHDGGSHGGHDGGSHGGHGCGGHGCGGHGCGSH